MRASSTALDSNEPYLDTIFTDIPDGASPADYLSVGMKVSHPSFGSGVIQGEGRYG